MKLTAIITRVETFNKSAPARFLVGVRREDGATVVRFLLRGPWCRSTANKKRRDVQQGLDDGTYRDPFGAGSLRRVTTT